MFYPKIIIKLRERSRKRTELNLLSNGVDPQANQYSPWNPSQPYLAGERVNFIDLVWEARNNNQSTQPSTNHDWKLLSKVLFSHCNDLYYRAGDITVKKNIAYKAIRDNLSEQPENSSAWSRDESIALDGFVRL